MKILATKRVFRQNSRKGQRQALIGSWFSIKILLLFHDFSEGDGGSLIPKWAKFASHIRLRTLTFLTWVIVTKMLSKIADVLRFFETFSSLIPVASFASGRRHPALGTPEGTPPRSGWRRHCAHYASSIRDEKSLQNLKNQRSQSIFVRSPKLKKLSPRSHR